jgi:hypothetical protein
MFGLLFVTVKENEYGPLGAEETDGVEQVSETPVVTVCAWISTMPGHAGHVGLFHVAVQLWVWFSSISTFARAINDIPTPPRRSPYCNTPLTNLPSFLV